MACITLLSDFGLQDASVAIAKGILMQHAPHIAIFDISHDIMPFHVHQAAYLITTAAKHFPSGTCHLLLFDVFSEKTPRLLLTEYNKQYFLGSDNGIIPTAFNIENSWQYFEMNGHHTYIDWLIAAAKAANLLQDHKPEALGLPAYTLRSIAGNTSHLPSSGTVECEVIHIDNYGNVVLNITKGQFESLTNGRQFRIQFKSVEDIDVIGGGYSDVRPGYKLCRFNSNGFLEICINRGNAASLFGLRLGKKNNDIKILFE